jgi:DNA repair protein RAD50
MHRLIYNSTQYSHIAGEVSSHKSQLKAWELDLKEFKEINKRYTDQLIRVKVSTYLNHNGHLI